MCCPMSMYDDDKDEVQTTSQPPAGGRVKRLFDIPYRIDSPEAPADLSHIGNGKGHLIDDAVAELIGEEPEEQVLTGELDEAD